MALRPEVERHTPNFKLVDQGRPAVQAVHHHAPSQRSETKPAHGIEKPQCLF